MFYGHIFQSQDIWVGQQLEKLNFSQSGDGKLKQVRREKAIPENLMSPRTPSFS